MSLENVFLIVASASISPTVAIAPGAVGRRPPCLGGVEGRRATGDDRGVQHRPGLHAAWNAVFGLAMLARTIGWEQTRKLMHRKKKDDAEADEAEGTEGTVPAEQG